MRSGVVQFIYRCEPYRGGQNFNLIIFLLKLKVLIVLTYAHVKLSLNYV